MFEIYVFDLNLPCRLLHSWPSVEKWLPFLFRAYLYYRRDFFQCDITQNDYQVLIY